MSYSDRHYGAGDPACPICQGVGYVAYNVPEDHALFGKVSDCSCRITGAASARADYLRKLGGFEFLAQKTFSSFDSTGAGLPPRQQENLQRAAQAAASYAEQPRGWLVLMGGYGCGKTHLAAAIANAQIDAGRKALLVGAPDLLDYLRSGFNASPDEDGGGYQARFDELKSAPLLVLDDLGVESPTAWANEKLYQLLNYRYVAQLPTVITTNKRLDEIEERLRSRLSDAELCQTITIIAPDYRGGGGASSQGGLRNLGIYASLTFAAFKPREDIGAREKENLQKAVTLAKKYAAKPSGWLALMGPPGSGKTHLAAAIANEQMNQPGGSDLIMVYLPDLMDHLRAAFSPNSRAAYDREFDEVKRVSLLILDNLEIASATPWAMEKLHQLLNYRAIAKLPTVMTARHKLEDIEALDARLAARLRDPFCKMFTILAPPFTSKS